MTFIINLYKQNYPERDVPKSTHSCASILYGPQQSEVNTENHVCLIVIWNTFN